MALSMWHYLVLALFACIAPGSALLNSATNCTSPPTTQHLSQPPYENYFYSDCHSATQVVVTSPRPDSNLSIIGPRLIVSKVMFRTFSDPVS